MSEDTVFLVWMFATLSVQPSALAICPVPLRGYQYASGSRAAYQDITKTFVCRVRARWCCGHAVAIGLQAAEWLVCFLVLSADLPYVALMTGSSTTTKGSTLDGFSQAAECNHHAGPTCTPCGTAIRSVRLRIDGCMDVAGKAGDPVLLPMTSKMWS